MWKTFLNWDADLLDEETKAQKSIWFAIHAVEKFVPVFDGTHLDEYELCFVDLLPAIELSFSIVLPNGFIYRGFVDAVLRHKQTGQLLVLELKTTSLTNIDEAQYKNSAQALGYSIILDSIAPGASEYKVLYLVYKTKAREYEPLPFNKSYFQRALWIQQLLFDIDLIEKYSAANLFPMYGESCYSFFRQCEWFNLCHMRTENLVDVNDMSVKEEKFTITLTIQDLIQSQLSKEVVV